MTPVAPRDRDGAEPVVFAVDQPEYIPLPANVTPDGLVMTEWVPTAQELTRLREGARILLWIWGGGRPLPPVAFEIVNGTD